LMGTLRRPPSLSARLLRPRPPHPHVVERRAGLRKPHLVRPAPLRPDRRLRLDRSPSTTHGPGLLLQRNRDRPTFGNTRAAILPDRPRERPVRHRPPSQARPLPPGELG